MRRRDHSARFDGRPPVTAYVGTAGWSLPAVWQPRFPAEGTHLDRYSAVLGAVEINSSFYRPHRERTYEKWAGATPAAFRFSVKLPKTITHERRLADAGALLDEFLPGPRSLGGRLGCLLVQLPPSLALDRAVADAFFGALRTRHGGAVACEPRHPTWFGPEGDALLAAHRVARVAADPPRTADGDRPGGWAGLVYYRLHGSPRVYYSDYDDASLDATAAALARHAAAGVEAWCIFDNTALGAATGNALAVRERLGGAAD
jgi:uncharacterized protein YecE (DUF72 family)